MCVGVRIVPYRLGTIPAVAKNRSLDENEAGEGRGREGGRGGGREGAGGREGGRGGRGRERARERAADLFEVLVGNGTVQELRGRDMFLGQKRGGCGAGVRGEAREQNVEGVDGLQARGEGAMKGKSEHGKDAEERKQQEGISGRERRRWFH